MTQGFPSLEATEIAAAANIITAAAPILLHGLLTPTIKNKFFYYKD